MEYITMSVATTFSRSGAPARFSGLWIGQEEIAIEERSIMQCLEEMRQQGWELIKSRATADPHGILCTYDFQRPLAMPQVQDSAFVDLSHRL
jgi:hypothetical protein